MKATFDLLRNMWSSPLDPIIPHGSKAYKSNRAIIDACRPYDWIKDFPQSVKVPDELAKQVRADQRVELVGREHDGVEIDLLEIAGRRLRQVGVAVRARAPGVIDAAGIGAEIAAAMHGEDLQLRMPLQHAVEDQVMQRHGGVEWIADDVVEVVIGVVDVAGDPDPPRIGALDEKRRFAWK